MILVSGLKAAWHSSSVTGHINKVTLRAHCTCLDQMVNHAVKCLESRCLTAGLTIWSDTCNVI